MLCKNTDGEHPAIHISNETIELAQDIQRALNAMLAQGHGDGEIKLTVSKGRIPFIDWTFRQFRRKK